MVIMVTIVISRSNAVYRMLGLQNRGGNAKSPHAFVSVL